MAGGGDPHRLAGRVGDRRPAVRSRDRPVAGILPCESRISTWGEELYFTLPLRLPLEPDAQQVVDPGTVCFWVDGSALALPWGRTPVSRGDPALLASARDGDPVRIEAA